MKSLLRYSYIVIALCAAAATAWACTTKVSEWTMLNLQPTSYMLVYYSDRDIDSATQAQHNSIEESIKDANIFLQTVDTRSFKYDHERDYFAMTGREKLPFYALFYMNRFMGAYNGDNLPVNLTTSKIRSTIAEHLKEGELCVLVYLETGDRLKDAAGRQTVQRALQKSILKDIVPVVTVTRTDKEESAFVDLLLQTDKGLTGLNEPMLFGAFGRFRVLEPLVGDAVTEENIEYMMQFLTMDCSCLVKYNMPGIDMLHTDDWYDIRPAKLNVIITQ
jgi:hypothetical protein